MAAPLPDPIIDVSKNKSPADNPDPFETISTAVTAPPETVTFAVTPFQVLRPLSLKSLRLLYVPLV